MWLKLVLVIFDNVCGWVVVYSYCVSGWMLCLIVLFDNVIIDVVSMIDCSDYVYLSVIGFLMLIVFWLFDVGIVSVL